MTIDGRNQCKQIGGRRMGKRQWRRLSVGDSDTLQLVSLLEGVRVRRLFGGVDELVGQALGDRLNVTERGLASTF